MCFASLHERADPQNRSNRKSDAHAKLPTCNHAKFNVRHDEHLSKTHIIELHASKVYCIDLRPLATPRPGLCSCFNSRAYSTHRR